MYQEVLRSAQTTAGDWQKGPLFNYYLEEKKERKPSKNPQPPETFVPHNSTE